MTRDKIRDIWYDATNAVCQEMQDRDMCRCPDGECLAAKIEPSEADLSFHEEVVK